MASDIARISYDEGRQWRSVVSQQGRVTLEADVNEAWTIAAEEQRKDLIDVVGPAGTPDMGYAVTVADEPAGPYDFKICAGTMYVGGMRVELLDDDWTY